MLKAPEVAAMLGLKARTVYELADRGILPCYRLIACTALLTACGGGGGEDQPQPQAGCKASAAVTLPGAGSIATVRLDNQSAEPRRYTISGHVGFSGQASGQSGGYSTLVLADGQSPVAVGTIKAEAAGAATGTQPFSTDVVVAPGAAATWALAHAPLPAPYGWASMRFSAIELCVR